LGFYVARYIDLKIIYTKVIFWGYRIEQSKTNPQNFFFSGHCTRFLPSCIAVQLKNILPFPGVYVLANNFVEEVSLSRYPKGVLKNQIK